jgi:hypothetical protein
MGDAGNDGPSPPLIGRIEVHGGGFLYLPLTVVLEFLAHDWPAAEALVLAAVQPPISRRLEQARSRRRQMSKATKTRRTIFGVLPIIAGVLGSQEVSMSQANGELVSRLDRRQDDSAGCAARHVEARWFDGRRGQGQSRGLRVPAAGCCGPHRTAANGVALATR